MQAYIRRGAWFALQALLVSAPVWAQGGAASDGVQRSAGPADPSDNVQYEAGPADPSDDLVPAGKHFSLAAAKALPPLGAAGEASPYLFGLSENDIIAAALAAKPDRVDLDLVLERMRKPFDASKFGTLHHAVGHDGMLRIVHRSWELDLAQVSAEAAWEDVRRLIERERDAHFDKMYPNGVPDQDPYWAGGDSAREKGGSASRSWCSSGRKATTTSADGLWKLEAEAYSLFYSGSWLQVSYASAHKRACKGVPCWWVKKKVDSITVRQQGLFGYSGSSSSRITWWGSITEYDEMETWYYGHNTYPDWGYFTSEASISDSAFGAPLSVTACAEF